MKLDPNKDYYNQEFGWVGHEEGEDRSPAATKIKANRYRLEILGGIVDEDASYEYDEFALVELDGEYYLLRTSGCSCPSPSQTWGVEIGPATRKEIADFVRGGHYQGYTLPKQREADFLELIEGVKK